MRINVPPSRVWTSTSHCIASGCLAKQALLPTMITNVTHDLPLVALSVVLTTFAAYAALELTGRLTAARGGARVFWVIGGSTAMGMGICAMHYVDMFALSLPMPVFYHLPTVLLSLLAAIAGSAAFLFAVSSPVMRLW